MQARFHNIVGGCQDGGFIALHCRESDGRAMKCNELQCNAMNAKK
jgi:hypothetical protein